MEADNGADDWAFLTKIVSGRTFSKLHQHQTLRKWIGNAQAVTFLLVRGQEPALNGRCLSDLWPQLLR